MSLSEKFHGGQFPSVVSVIDSLIAYWIARNQNGRWLLCEIVFYLLIRARNFMTKFILPYYHGWTFFSSRILDRYLRQIFEVGTIWTANIILLHKTTFSYIRILDENNWISFFICKTLYCISYSKIQYILVYYVFVMVWLNTTTQFCFRIFCSFNSYCQNYSTTLILKHENKIASSIPVFSCKQHIGSITKKTFSAC